MRLSAKLTAIAASGVLAAGTLALAGPALADSAPTTASVTVPTSVTLSGVAASIHFPDTPAGGTATAAHAQTYSVSSNDPAGYTLTLNPASVNFADPSNSASIPNSSLSIAENSAGHSVPGSAWSAGQVMINHTTSAGEASGYDETWSLDIPSAAPAATYSENFTYTATGN